MYFLKFYTYVEYIYEYYSCFASSSKKININLDDNWNIDINLNINCILYLNGYLFVKKI